MILPDTIDRSGLRAAAAERDVNHAVFLGAGAEMQCGVGHFTKLLFETVHQADPQNATTLDLNRTNGSFKDIWRAVGKAKTVVCNFPIVAWKRVIFRPLTALALARLRGRNVVLVLHEWGGLHWMRRLTYMPALVLANTIVLFSPLVRKELEQDPWIGWTTSRATLAPLPPNIAAPAHLAQTPLRDRLAQARQDRRLVIGYFGSIYPGKQPEALLRIGAILKAHGERPLLVYAGSFIRGSDHVERDFHDLAQQLGIADDVIVSGFIASDEDLFGIFSEIDVFCYQLTEGVSARRASILTAVQSGRPVIVTAPADPLEFAHHPGFQLLISANALILVDRKADDAAYASAILQTAKQLTQKSQLDFDMWWRDVAGAIVACF